MHTACLEVMRPTSPTLSNKNKVGYHNVLCSQPKKKGAASQLLQLQAINRCIKHSPKQVQPAWCSSQDGTTLNRNIQATQINSDQLSLRVGSNSIGDWMKLTVVGNGEVVSTCLEAMR